MMQSSPRKNDWGRISDNPRTIPIVYLSEKSLERLHMKLKSSTSGNTDIERTEEITSTRTSSKSSNKKIRQPKQQFYQAGQSHLSRKADVKHGCGTPRQHKSANATRSPSKSSQKSSKSEVESFHSIDTSLTTLHSSSSHPTDLSLNEQFNLNTFNIESPSKVSTGKRYNNLSRLPVEEGNVTTESSLYDADNSSNDRILSPSSRPLSSPIRTSRRSLSNRELIDFDTYYSKNRSLSICSNEDDNNTFNNDNKVTIKTPSSRQRKSSEPLDIVSNRNAEKPSDQTVATLGKLAVDAESRLENLLDKLDGADENLASRRLFEEREQLKSIYRRMLLKDIEYASKNGVDNLLWKNIFYQLVEKLRGQLEFSYDDERENIKSVLLDVFDQGQTFYKELLVDLQKVYEFSLDEVPFEQNCLESKRKSHLKKMKLAVMICQKIFLCLGDLARYRESTNESTEFGTARKWYLSAKKVEPRNGRPYNQLALLAVLTKRRLDAVYYYIRSLGAGNPVLTAKESLLALFNDIRRKKEYLKKKEKKPSISPTSSDSLRDKSNNGAFTNYDNDQNLPLEEWVLPHIYSSTQQDFDKLAASHEEVHCDLEKAKDKSINPSIKSDEKSTAAVNTSTLKEFILSFLNLNGILYTRIAFDMFEEQMSHAISLFSSILKSPKGIPEKTAMCLFTVVFFTVHHQLEKSKGDFYNNLFFIRSVEFTFAMIICVCQKVHEILLASNLSGRNGKLDSESSMWISLLKISCDWLYTNKSLWTGHNDFTKFHNIYDLTNNLAQVLNLLHTSYFITSTDHKFKKVDGEEYGSDEVIKLELPEDDEFKGFSPLSHFEEGPQFLLKFEMYDADMRYDAFNFLRYNIIYEFLLFLCGIDFPLIAFKGGKYITLVPRVIEVENVFSGNTQQGACFTGGGDTNMSLSPRPYHNFDESSNKSPTLDQYQVENDLGDLKLYHSALQQTKQYQDKRQQLIQTSLDKASDIVSSRRSVKVCPQFLVPDTNCFIDHLNLIHKILERSDYYVVCVPLIVFIELKGLATHSKSSNSHAISVKDSAKTAFDFLSDVFTRRNHDFRIKALTNQGTKLETFSFLSQEVESAGSNDDFILQCCLRHEEKQSKITSNSNVLTTVLLTDDRNLRVKALTKNTPAKSLPDFCRWTMI